MHSTGVDLRLLPTGVSVELANIELHRKRHRRLGTRSKLWRCIVEVIVVGKSINLIPPASTHHTALPTRHFSSAYLSYAALQDQQSHHQPVSSELHHPPETDNTLNTAPFVSRHPQTRAAVQGCEIGGVLPTSSRRPGSSAANLILWPSNTHHINTPTFFFHTTVYLLTTTLHNRAPIYNYTYTKQLDKTHNHHSSCIAPIPCASRALRQLPKSRTLLLPRHRQSQAVSLAKAVLVSVSHYDIRIDYAFQYTARVSRIHGVSCMGQRPAIRQPASAPKNALKLRSFCFISQCAKLDCCHRKFTGTISPS